MKPVFKCDYCDFMGAEKEVVTHEETCMYNYNRRGCYTCQHQNADAYGFFSKCKLGKETLIGKYYEFCPDYERSDESKNSEE